jgi:hypothetical protein
MMSRVLPLVLCAACGSDGPFMIVTIQSQPAVHDVEKLEVELDNEGRIVGDSFTVDDQTFPATFSISAPDRTGNLTIRVSARDDEGFLVGRGTSTTTVDALDATVLLDSADFVVNTDFADDQFPSRDFESDGFQVSAGADGVWTAVYRDACPAPCNMFARRFDATGLPVNSGLAAGINGFAISTEVSDGFFTTPAAATGGSTTIAVWNFSEPSPGTLSGIACRAIDSAGNGVGAQATVALETSFPFAVSATPLMNGSFAVAWQGRSTENLVRSSIVNAQCTASTPVDVSTVVGGANRPAVAANGNSVMYTWVLAGDARLRVMDQANAQISTDQLVVAKTATEEVEFTRVTKLGTGFGIFVRWATLTRTGPGRIELYKTNNVGMIQGAPVLITTKTSSDFDSAHGFSVATRPDDGSVLVAWHTCGEVTDDSGCGVFGRLVSSTGTPIGEDFNLATTTDLEQTSPSVAGLPGAFAAVWSDASKQEPDIAGTAVRARVIYGPSSGGASAKRDPENTHDRRSLGSLRFE